MEMMMKPSNEYEAVKAAFAEAAELDLVEDYLDAVDRLPEVTDQKERDALIAEHLYNRHNAWLRAKEYGACKQLLTHYVALIPRIGHTQGLMPGAQSGRMMNIREAIAGDACALWSFSKDDAVWPLVTELVPEKITVPALAYNLACAAAIRKDKVSLLNFVQQAMNLGKETTQFMGDSDFDWFKKDPDFLRAID